MVLPVLPVRAQVVGPPPTAEELAKYTDVVSRHGNKLLNWEPSRNTARFGRLVSDEVRKTVSRQDEKIIITCHQSVFVTGTSIGWCEWAIDGDEIKVVRDMEIVSPRVAAGAGIRVGDPAGKVRQRFGAPDDPKAAVWAYADEGTRVDFTIERGRVRKVVWHRYDNE